LEFRNHQGKRIFLLGVNYWPASAALNMWTEWNPEEIISDIQRMKKLGMNCCRPFLFMPAFVPGEGDVAPLMLERLDFFLDRCERQEIGAMPTFIVGHMSGEDWNASWSRGSDFITDEKMKAITRNYLRKVVQAVKTRRSVIAWLLSNELPNYIGNQRPELVTAWVKEMIAVIRAVDPDRPVSVGDGAWSPEITGEPSAFLLRKLNEYQDFVGLHYYPRGLSPWQHSYTTAFRTALAREWKRPVIIEEFGASTTLCSEENQAAYYRNVFYSALINGAQGALSWCLNDFDFPDKRPYSHHPFEERFGIIRTDKSLKPAAKEIAKFASIVEELIEYQSQLSDNLVGCLIPSNFYYHYPYLFDPDFKKWYSLYLETYTLLKRANLNVRILFEPAQELENGGALSHEMVLDPGQIPVLFIPRLKLLQKSTHHILTEYVEKGGTLYFSFANDSWVLDWHELAGVETDCKFGVPDFYDSDSLEITVKENWGQFKRGQKLQIPLNSSDPEYSYCPILHTSARVIMEDSYGSPFLVEHSFGKGTVYFCSFSIEMLALASRNEQWKIVLSNIYRSIHRTVYPNPLFAIEGDGLEMGVWKKGGDYRVIIFNHSWSDQPGRFYINSDNLSIASASEKYSKIDDEGYKLSLKRKEVMILSIVKDVKNANVKEE